MSTTFETDVLVIGSGGAGLASAVEASKYGVDVLIVSKGLLAHGNTRIAGGGMAAPFGQIDHADSPNEYFKDTLEWGELLNNKKLVRGLARDARRIVLDLERYGVIFERLEHQPTTFRAHSGGRGGQPPHSHLRVLSTGLGRGLELSNVMKEMVISLNLRFLDEVLITRLLKQGGNVVGATGIDIKTGEFLCFRAKSTILATGGIGGIFSNTDNMSENCGSGQGLAYRIGADLMDMEMVQFLPIALTHPESMRGIFITLPETVGPYGKLLNTKNERFMEKYDPELKEHGPRVKVCLAMVLEVREGRGTKYGGCLLDLSENKEGEPQLFDNWKNNRRFRDYRIVKEAYGEAAAEWEEPWDVYPTEHYMMGGIRVNEWCETPVPGLYVAGEAQAGTHGADRLGSNSLTEIFVFGARAGKRAAKRALKIRLPRISSEQVSEEHKRMMNSLKHNNSSNGIRPILVKRELQKLMQDHVGVIREASGLTFAIKKISELRKQLTSVCITSDSARYNMEWINTLELPLMIDVAETIARSALMRNESRGTHSRMDFPRRDDRKWMKNIVVRCDKGHMKLTTVNTGS